MNPTVEVAWIAAGVAILSLAATIAIAIIGYRSARKVAIEAARHERIKGRMTDTYEGVLIALIRRQVERRDAAIFYRSPDAEERMRGAELRDNHEWLKAQGRAAAYSSPEVRRGLELVRLADEDVAMHFSVWQSVKKETGTTRKSGTESTQEQSSGELRERMNQALELSEQIENSLIDLIRAELKAEETTKLVERLNQLTQRQPWAFLAAG